MIVKIMKPADSVFSVLGYNENKVEGEDAVLVAWYNMDSDSEESIPETFAHRERIARSEGRQSFHMVISPAEGEDFDDTRMKEYARRLMDGLGYGEQPYVLYRHEDTAHVHWHVVATRVRENGCKVHDSYSSRRCRAIAENLQEEFGYVYGRRPGPKMNRFGVAQFDPDCPDKLSAMRELFSRALEYRFTSYTQFEQILRVHGLAVRERTGLGTKLVLQGLDETGKACTPEFTEKQLGMRLYSLYSARAKEGLKTFRDWKGNSERVSGLLAEPLRYAASQQQLRRFARQHKVDFTLRRNPDTHRISGGDFIDHETKCAFSLSDFDRKSGLDLSAVREADEERWHQDETHDNGPHVTIGDLLAGLSTGTSRSREKDMKDDPRKRRKGRRM